LAWLVYKEISRLRDPCVASITGVLGSSYPMISVKLEKDQPWLPWQRNLRQNRL